MKNSEEVIVSDKDIQQITKITGKINESITSLKAQDKELKKLKDNSVDLVITSPPYWKGFGYEAYFNSYSQYLRWSKLWMKEIKRVLKPNGTLIFKWNEVKFPVKEILKLTDKKPLYGHKSGIKMQTHWICFIKD